MVYFYDGKNQADKKPYSFNKKVKFYAVESITNPNTDSPVPQYVYKLTLHYSPVKRSIEDKLSDLGTNREDILIISVKHREAVQETLTAEIGDKYYAIQSIMPDDSNSPIPYDTLVLKKTERRYRVARK
jgi:SPP1 family predicted phage head-tail adaptor